MAVLIRHGVYCRHCKTECVEKPNEYAPAWLNEIPCPACRGDKDQRKFCKVCRGRGKDKLTDCPRKAVAPETWELIRQFKHAEKGALPEPGGTNSQCETFLRAWEEFDYLESVCKSVSGTD